MVLKNRVSLGYRRNETQEKDTTENPLDVDRATENSPVIPKL